MKLLKKATLLILSLLLLSTTDVQAKTTKTYVYHTPLSQIKTLYWTKNNKLILKSKSRIYRFSYTKDRYFKEGKKLKKKNLKMKLSKKVKYTISNVNLKMNKYEYEESGHYIYNQAVKYYDPEECQAELLIYVRKNKIIRVSLLYS